MSQISEYEHCVSGMKNSLVMKKILGDARFLDDKDVEHQTDFIH